VELDAERTVVAGLSSADAVVLNDQDLSHTRTGFDARSAQVLTAAACQLGDPLSEAVCWNGFWLLVTGGELPAAQFTDMVCRRLQAGGLPAVGVETLLSRAVEAADGWAPPRQRAGLREQIADATRTAAGDARKLALGFAASAQTDDQLAGLGAWLAGKDLPDGLAIDAELRARILFTLAARGLARADDIDALPRLDPVTGEVNRATCLAMQPDPAAKEAAWAMAISSAELTRMAQAAAAGIWVPGQEELMAGYRDRYFTEALPALVTRKVSWSRSRLGTLLFPVTLVSEATIEAANAAEPSDNVLRLTVADQGTIMRRRLAARRASALADERLLRAYHAELVSLGVGQDRPGFLAGLPDVDAARPEREQSLDLLVAVFGAAGQVEVQAVLDRLGIGDRHEAQADRRVLVRADDDLALTLGQDPPAERLGPEPGQRGQVVSVDHDVMESDRHAASMRGHALMTERGRHRWPATPKRGRPTVRPLTLPARLVLVDDDAADVLAVEQVVVALVDLVEGVRAGDDLVELDVA
jgi:hypothetical protein